METLQKAQAVIEYFREAEGESFSYSFGRSEPQAAFLFQIPNKNESSIFGYVQDEHEAYSIFSDQYGEIEMKDDGSGYNFCRLFESMLFAAGEMYCKRCSVTKYQCTICKYKGTMPQVVNHIVSEHSTEIAKFIKPHLKFIDDDSKPYFGIYTKCQFDACITLPTKPFLPNRGQFGNISAPALAESDELEFEEEDPEQSDSEADHITLDTSAIEPATRSCYYVPKFIDPLSSQEPFSVSMSVCSKPPYSKVARKRAPKHLDTNYYEQERANTEDFTRKENILKPLFTMYAPEEKPKHEEEKPIEQIQTIESIQEEETHEEEETPEPVPQFVTFLSTIPEDILDEVVKGIASKSISEFVDQQSISIAKPLLQNQKKAHFKRVREEQRERQREEEKKRIEELRERRNDCINRLSKQIAPSFLRAFLRAKTDEIFNAAAESTAAEKSRVVRQQTSGIAGQTTTVVVSGLTSQRHLSMPFLVELFASLGLQVKCDEQKQPLIRFRVRYKRFEVLVVLADEAAVAKALGMSPLQVEYSTAMIEADTELPPEDCWQTFAEQKILQMNLMRNLEGVRANGGLDGYLQMSAMSDLSANVQ